MDNELAIQEAEVVDTGIVSLTSKMNLKQLKNSADKETQRREVITEFVNKQLKEGIDYGKIESTSASGKSFKSKPTLFKPGQEKIFSLFGLTSECVKDTETLEMLSSINNLIAYKCNVYKNGRKIAEGRGAAEVGENKRDVNSTIKIAEKRARMDACLSLGFSEFFTQDLDDMVTKSEPTAATEKQWKYLLAIWKRMGNTESLNEYVVTQTGKKWSELNHKEASDLIKELLEYEETLKETDKNGGA